MENNAGITTKKNSRKTLITVLVALVAAAVVLGGIMIALKLKAEKEEELRQSIINSGTFHTGITVGGVDVSGMTMEEASSALKTAEDKLTENVGFVVSDGENEYRIEKSFFTKADLVNIRRPVIFAFLQKFRAAFSFFAEMPDFPAHPVFLRIFR